MIQNTYYSSGAKSEQGSGWSHAKSLPRHVHIFLRPHLIPVRVCWYLSQSGRTRGQGRVEFIVISIWTHTCIWYSYPSSFRVTLIGTIFDNTYNHWVSLKLYLWIVIISHINSEIGCIFKITSHTSYKFWSFQTCAL